MEKPPAFVVPAGVTFQIGEDGVHIENRGDIVLHTDFGRTLTRVVSHEGAIELHTGASVGLLSARNGITVHGPLDAAEIESGGDVTVGGDGSLKRVKAAGALSVAGNVTGGHIAAGSVRVEGDAQVDQLHATGSVNVAGAFTGGTVRGQDVTLAGPSVTARGIQGGRSVSVAGGKVQVDAIIAPEVLLDARTSGRVTVIESQNEVGPNAVKGGFRLADYEEMFGDPAQFLADRGLNALGDAPPAPPVPAAASSAPAAAPPAPASVAMPPPPSAAASSPLDAPAPRRAPPAAPPDPGMADPEPETPTVVTPAPTPTPVQMEIDEPDDESHGAAAPVATPPVADVPEHPLHPQLMDAVIKILECYGAAEVPPAVNHLRTLIDTRQYDQVRAEITTIWSDLLKFHQKKGMRIQHQVTTTFNTINSLVKKM
jgi:hypothetical protein